MCVLIWCIFQPTGFLIFMVHESTKNAQIHNLEKLQMADTEDILVPAVLCICWIDDLLHARGHQPKDVGSLEATTHKLMMSSMHVQYIIIRVTPSNFYLFKYMVLACRTACLCNILHAVNFPCPFFCWSFIDHVKKPWNSHAMWMVTTVFWKILKIATNISLLQILVLFDSWWKLLH